MLGTLIPESTRGLPAIARLKSAATMAVKGQAFGRAHNEASCEVARDMARRIGLRSSVSDGLYDMHEWWNGRGARGVRGEEIARSGRADVEDALGFIRTMPRVADLFVSAPTDKQQAAMDVVREALALYAGADGVVMHNNGEWLVTAHR